jgi:D-3-phosphoglycerate dehydrogenase
MKIKTLNSISPIIYTMLKEDLYEVGSDIDQPDAILVRSADMHNMQLSEATLAIGRAGAGTNNIPVDSCSQKGIVVFNTPGANANAVRELVIAGLLLAGRDIVGGIQWAYGLKGQGAAVAKMVEKGKNQFVGPELKGKKLGVVGMGAIGVLVANAAVGLEMKVVGYDPYMSVDAALHLTRQVSRVEDLDTLISECDYITLHLPLNEQTRDMMNHNRFALMKEGAVLLNYSRGELVNTQDLLETLATGQLARYVTDFPSDDILCHPKVIATPHLGASTPESEENCAQMAAQELADYLENGNILHSVNFPDCTMARSDAYRLCVLHANVANIVGPVTAALGAAGINIGGMINKSRGNWAYTMVDISQKPSQETLDAIAAVSGISRLRVI